MLSYADAARLLGGGESQLVKALDRVTGGLLIAGAAAGVPALLGWLDARREFVRLSQDLVRKLSERRTGISRYHRTERLEAAHTVLVVTAYFAALADADLPFRFAELELTKQEQLALAGKDAALPPGGTSFLEDVRRVRNTLPDPRHSLQARLRRIGDYFGQLSEALTAFVRGLAVWDRLTETEQGRFAQTLAEEVPARAGERYEESLRRLAADFPEVAYWANLHEHQATRAEVRGAGAALARLERMLGEISTGRAPDARRQELARAYRAALDRPVVASGDVPGELRLPTLEAGYIAPRFRVGVVDRPAKLTDESWWEDQPVRSDLAEFLAASLTYGPAVATPLLVLGQPGSGKSVLTQVLAARLPVADFLPVRVVLREVPTAASLQDQIEYAVRSATGERLEWPALARSAGDALPVVILDGFDELLQATGVSQTDYLLRVAEFQQREADQGRPVAVLVTSRTSVADRARLPEAIVSLRLEPFDDTQVTAWLAAWNRANQAGFRSRGVAPLTAEAVLAHRELAGQPLLLLMLALHDATGNALQRGVAGLREDELYEQLLSSFARREVTKHRPGLPERELDRAAEQELRRLSVVGFGMFNRGSQWITEPDLESDLLALFGEAAPAPPSNELRAPLRTSEIVLGRFFFVHRAQATRDDTTLETYEFLHATFGEYMVARLTWQVLRDLAAREAASTMSLSAAPVNDDLLQALLSFGVLSQRGPIIRFLTDLAARLTEADRAALGDLLIRLFRVVHQPRSGRGFASYQPQVTAVPTRHAAYSANLVLLTVSVAGTVRVSDLFGAGTEDVYRWRDEVMLWRSQLRSDEWASIIETVALHRGWGEAGRDLWLELDHGDFQVPAVDPYWSFSVPPGHAWRQRSVSHFEFRPEVMHRRAHYLCRIGEDLAEHALEPLTEVLGVTLHTISGGEQEPPRSAAHVLLDAWLMPLRNPPAEQRRATYLRCVDLAVSPIEPWDEPVRAGYTTLLLERLTTDDQVPADVVAEVLSRLVSSSQWHSLLPEVAPPLVRCGLAFLGKGGPASGRRIAEAVNTALAPSSQLDPDLANWAANQMANAARWS